MAVGFARVLADHRCSDVQILDVRGVSDLCDFVLIATGTSRPQMKTALTRLEDFAKAHGEAALPVPDQNSERWMVADFVTVVAHVFHGDWRSYYDLEMLWGDVPRVAWHAPGGKS